MICRAIMMWTSIPLVASLVFGASAAPRDTTRIATKDNVTALLDQPLVDLLHDESRREYAYDHAVRTELYEIVGALFGPSGHQLPMRTFITADFYQHVARWFKPHRVGFRDFMARAGLPVNLGPNELAAFENNPRDPLFIHSAYALKLHIRNRRTTLFDVAFVIDAAKALSGSEEHPYKIINYEGHLAQVEAALGRPLRDFKFDTITPAQSPSDSLLSPNATPSVLDQPLIEVFRARGVELSKTQRGQLEKLSGKAFKATIDSVPTTSFLTEKFLTLIKSTFYLHYARDLREVFALAGLPLGMNALEISTFRTHPDDRLFTPIDQIPLPDGYRTKQFKEANGVYFVVDALRGFAPDGRHRFRRKKGVEQLRAALEKHLGRPIGFGEVPDPLADCETAMSAFTIEQVEAVLARRRARGE